MAKFLSYKIWPGKSEENVCLNIEAISDAQKSENVPPATFVRMLSGECYTLAISFENFLEELKA